MLYMHCNNVITFCGLLKSMHGSLLVKMHKVARLNGRKTEIKTAVYLGCTGFFVSVLQVQSEEGSPYSANVSDF